MKLLSEANFSLIEKQLGVLVQTEGDWVATKHWQAQDISSKNEMVPKELMNVSIVFPIPDDPTMAQLAIEPNLPWAEAHFQERVSGDAINPPPSHKLWPFARDDNSEHMMGGRLFAHTYPERFWPKWAHVNNWSGGDFSPMAGIRFTYGDLNDVVDLLLKDLYTRQAFLPVFFPEDTGATSEQRIPCTLGYHFMVRQDQMHVVYYIRSCDFLRHFRDDVYMACRLGQWVRDALEKRTGKEIDMGTLTMHMASLHVFQGDLQLMKLRYKSEA